MTLYVFKDQLYIGTTKILRGFSLYTFSDGLSFQQVFASGYTDRENAYLWSMQECNGRIYAGTVK